MISYKIAAYFASLTISAWILESDRVFAAVSNIAKHVMQVFGL